MTYALPLTSITLLGQNSQLTGGISLGVVQILSEYNYQGAWQVTGRN
jgi:hypothetical protein